MENASYAYEVTHRATGKVTFYKTLRAAIRAQTRLDNAYGSYITTRRRVRPE